MKIRNRSILAFITIVIAITIKHYYEVWDNSPYAYLTDLSNNKQYSVIHNVTIISRYTEDKQPDNYIPISPSRIVSRMHFLINRNTSNYTSEAFDVRSSFGTMINGDFLPYGQMHTLQHNDLISLAGNQNFRYTPVEKSISPKPPLRLDPAPEADQWGIFIDGKNKKIIALTENKYFLSYDASSGYSLQKNINANTLAEIDIIDKNNNPIEAILITDIKDDNDLYKKSKVSRYDAYKYKEDLVAPNISEYLGARIEAKPIVFHYDKHYFQIVTVPEK